eukprot:g7052.t1
MDVIPIRSIEKLISETKSCCFAFLESPDMVNNAILASSLNNAFIDRLLQDLHEWSVLNHGREAWEVTGPKYLTHAARSFRSEIKIYPSSFFNSIHFSMIKHLKEFLKINNNKSIENGMQTMKTLQQNQILNNRNNDTNVAKLCSSDDEVNLTYTKTCSNTCVGSNILDTKIFGFHVYSSRVKIMPTILTFIPVDITGRKDDIQVKIKIAPWRGESDNPDGGLWEICAQLLKYPSQERCKQIPIRRDVAIYAVLDFPEVSDGRNYVRAWIKDGYGVPHASSSIKTEIYVVEKNPCFENKGKNKLDNVGNILQPYWCKFETKVFGLKLEPTETKSKLVFDPKIGPLHSAFVFGASVSSGFSDAYRYQLATKLHLYLAPKMHDRLKHEIDNATNLFDLKLFEDAKKAFLKLLDFVNRTEDAVAPHRKADVFNGMLTYSRFVGNEKDFYKYLQLTLHIIPDHFQAHINYAIFLHHKSHHEHAIEIMERVYEASIGPHQDLLIKRNLFKVYIWSNTSFGLSRALSLGVKLLNVRPSNLFVWVALSQVELLDVHVYEHLHKFLCLAKMFCVSTSNHISATAGMNHDGESNNKNVGSTIFERLKSFHSSLELMHYTSALAVAYTRINKTYEWIYPIFNLEVKKYEQKISHLLQGQSSISSPVNVPTPSPITLIVEYFKPEKQHRLLEILEVMWINVNNKYISKICILTETAILYNEFIAGMNEFCTLIKKKKEKDCKSLYAKKFINNNIGERATFKHAIDYGQNDATNKDGFMIIANADIYFDESLKFIAYNSEVAVNDETFLNRKCYALLRWECLNGIAGMNSIKKINLRSDSQDAWIMPLPFHFNATMANFYFGKNGADNSFAQLLYDQNIHVSSPSFIIRTNHLHRTQNSRTYSHLDHVASQSTTSPYVKVSYRFKEGEKIIMQDIKGICDKHVKKLVELRKQNIEHVRFFSGLPLQRNVNFETKSLYELNLEIKQLKTDKNAWEKECNRLSRMLLTFSENLKSKEEEITNLKQLLIEKETKINMLQSTGILNERLKLSLFQKINKIWMCKVLAIGFRTWTGYIKDCLKQERNKYLLNRFIKMWRYKRTKSVIRQWKQYIRSQKQARVCVRRVFQNFKHKSFACSFRTWHENTEKAALYAESNRLHEDLKRQKKVYTEKIIYRTIKKMQNQCLSRCFHLLHTNAKYEREQKIAMQRTLARWIKRSLFHTFSRWANYSKTQHRHRRLVVKILARVQNQGLASALGKWRSFVMEDARMRIEKERLIIKLSNGLATESEIETILLVAIEQTKTLMDADRGTLFLYVRTKKAVLCIM